MAADKTNSNWIDVTVPLREGMAIWPGDVQLQIVHRSSMDSGAAANNSNIHLGVHTGTHMDAPKHFIKDGKSIDQLPLDTAVGPARVIEIKDKVSIKPAELKPYNIQRGERILFKTINSPRCWQTDDFVNDFVFITRDAAQFLVDAGVILIGIDYLSVGSPLDPERTIHPDTHQILLGAGLWLIEGLNLSSVKAGNYNLICLPLKLMNTEGSPVRAILQPLK
ncbi:MAG: cyclase family protein [Dehalococcoidales bacterium]